MSEYTEVEQPFLQQRAAQGGTVRDRSELRLPPDAALSLRDNFRQWLLPAVFDAAVRSINRTDGAPGSVIPASRRHATAVLALAANQPATGTRFLPKRPNTERQLCLGRMAASEQPFMSNLLGRKVVLFLLRFLFLIWTLRIACVSRFSKRPLQNVVLL